MPVYVTENGYRKGCKKPAKVFNGIVVSFTKQKGARVSLKKER